MEPCQVTRNVVAAFAAGTLRADPRLTAHVQVCTHCLTAVFGHYRQNGQNGQNGHRPVTPAPAAMPAAAMPTAAAMPAAAMPTPAPERLRVEADTLEP